MKKFIPALILTCSCMFCFTGCEMVSELVAPKFDASSVEAFEDSYAKMKEKLSPEDQKKLDEALVYQSAKYTKDHPGEALTAVGAAIFHGDTDNSLTKSFGKNLMKSFDGKTAKQVIREYEENIK